MKRFRVTNDIELWIVEDITTGKWWSVSGGPEQRVTSGCGRVLKPGSAAHRRITQAVKEFISA